MRYNGTTNYFVLHDTINEEKGVIAVLGEVWKKKHHYRGVAIQALGTIYPLTAMNWAP